MAITQFDNSDPRIQLGNIYARKRIVGYSDAVMLVSKPTELAIGATLNDLIRDNNSEFCQIIGLALSEHPAGSSMKPDIPADPYDRITILISGGPWTQRMWTEDPPKTDTEAAPDLRP